MPRLRSVLRRVAIALVAFVVLALVLVKLRYGRGSDRPDVSTPPLVPADAVEIAAELEFPLGNVTGSADGRIFFNIHPFAAADRFTDAVMFELVDGTPRPYPDLATQPELRFAFGMTVDRQNRLWLTCPATLDRERTRILAFDLAADTKVIDHELEPGVARFGQDLRVTPDGTTLILADTGAFRFTHASLFVVDIATWRARELLADDPSTQPQDLVIHTRTGEPHRIGYGLLSFQVGVDGIAIDDGGEWLYFATMSHDTLHRIPLAAVLDPQLAPDALAAAIERVGAKPLSDGIAITATGDVLVTDVEHGSLDRIDRSGELRTLVARDDIRWSDGVYVSAAGEVYLTDSAIPAYFDQLLRPPSRERLRAAAPYRLYRFRLPP